MSTSVQFYLKTPLNNTDGKNIEPISIAEVDEIVRKHFKVNKRVGAGEYVLNPGKAWHHWDDSILPLLAAGQPPYDIKEGFLEGIKTYMKRLNEMSVATEDEFDDEKYNEFTGAIIMYHNLIDITCFIDRTFFITTSRLPSTRTCEL